MNRLAAVVAIGLGVLVSCAPWSGPPAEAEQQAESPPLPSPDKAPASRTEGVNPPLPSREKAPASRTEGVSPPLPSRERVGVRGAEQTTLTSAASSASEDQEDPADDDAPMIDPMSANAACYVCHMTFIYEEFSKVHLAEKITCIECHGVSGPHANDENIGATPPDITFKREEVDASCAECHDEHDVPARKIIARSLERQLPDAKPICTDCHGTHKIEQAEEEVDEDAEEAKEEGGLGPGKSAAVGLREARSRAVSAQPY